MELKLPFKVHSTLLNFSDGPYAKEGLASLGCWAFANLDSFEGKEHLDGNYKNRSDAVRKCSIATGKHYIKMFALSDGGSCQGLGGSIKQYIQQGRSTKCAKDGRGGPDASQMYMQFRSK